MLVNWLPYLHTITLVKVKEFATHRKVYEISNIDYYFANLYHFWERGSNENLKGSEFIPFGGKNKSK